MSFIHRFWSKLCACVFEKIFYLGKMYNQRVNFEQMGKIALIMFYEKIIGEQQTR